MHEEIKSASNEISQDKASMNAPLAGIQEPLYVLKDVVQQYQNRQVLKIDHLEDLRVRS